MAKKYIPSFLVLTAILQLISFWFAIAKLEASFFWNMIGWKRTLDPKYTLEGSHTGWDEKVWKVRKLDFMARTIPKISRRLLSLNLILGEISELDRTEIFSQSSFFQFYFFFGWQSVLRKCFTRILIEGMHSSLENQNWFSCFQMLGNRQAFVNHPPTNELFFWSQIKSFLRYHHHFISLEAWAFMNDNKKELKLREKIDRAHPLGEQENWEGDELCLVPRNSSKRENFQRH